MKTNCQYIAFGQTGFFSKIIIDYLNNDEKIAPFYEHPISIEGIKASIAARQVYPTNRPLLVEVLKKQYAGIALNDLQQQNIDNLLKENTFTITTAHQPNLFTGHLYFIYKILHTVKLANFLAEQIPDQNFVPVFYMGSEDADLDELGHINLAGEKLEWKTSQTGAVGRMVVDKELIKLIDRIAGQLEVEAFGKELIAQFRKAYALGNTIQQATLLLVNFLFAKYGVLVLIPDNAALKQPFTEIVKRELAEQFSYPIVEETATELSKNYKVQASGRELNLFYLIKNQRERIEEANGIYLVKALNLKWSKAEIFKEAEEHPERFSANVILRGVFQEMILPNIAFIGGGGEIAYWLELKKVFEACAVPFPVLIVRNSFLLINSKQEEKLERLNFSIETFFKSTFDLMNELVKRESVLKLSLSKEKEQLQHFYKQVQNTANAIDVSLNDHVISLQKKAEKSIVELEKKMLRAEKRKFEDQQRQIENLKSQLFPNNSLQERIDNFAPYFARYGEAWIDKIYNASKPLDQDFGIIKLD